MRTHSVIIGGVSSKQAKRGWPAWYRRQSKIERSAKSKRACWLQMSQEAYRTARSCMAEFCMGMTSLSRPIICRFAHVLMRRERAGQRYEVIIWHRYHSVLRILFVSRELSIGLMAAVEWPYIKS